MTTKSEQFNKSQLNKNVPDIRPGDTVKVHQRIKEGDKERLQIFEGIVIARKHGKGVSTTITVRKIVEGIGVERIFPLHSPFINKIEVVRSGKVRRSKLYYLRQAKGKKAKLRKKDRDFAAAIAEKGVENYEEKAEVNAETSLVEDKPEEAMKEKSETKAE